MINLFTVWALLIFFASQPPAAVAVRMEMDPSELPQARMRPKSCGAQQTELTEESWLLYS